MKLLNNNETYTISYYNGAEKEKEINHYVFYDVDSLLYTVFRLGLHPDCIKVSHWYNDEILEVNCASVYYALKLQYHSKKLLTKD